MQQAGQDFDPSAITRPEPSLLTYYTIVAAATLLGFPFFMLPLYFKYHTLRYRFDNQGIAMTYGVLFRREIYLTYRRIQDIHLTRNLIQRWLGLATVSIQTASGSASPEMNVEGILEVEGLRDYLYSKMRGAREHLEASTTEPKDEALSLLREIRDLLRKQHA